MDANLVIHDIDSISCSMVTPHEQGFKRSLTICTGDGAIIDIDLLSYERNTLEFTCSANTEPG